MTTFNKPSAATPLGQTPPSQGGGSQAPAATPATLNAVSPVVNTTNNLGGVNTNNNGYTFTYPSSSDGMYFTATQSLIYIVNLYIDEVVNLQYTYQANRVPIYGYSSTDVDAFGQGKGLVQGQFAINMVTEGYLYVALDQYSKKMNTQVTSATVNNINRLSNAINNFSSGNTTLGSLSAPDSSQTSTNNQMKQNALNAIDQLAANLGPEGIQQAKSQLKANNAYQNAIRLRIPFNIVINFTGGGRTITKTLSECVLTSNDMVLDQSGEVVLDGYGFLARSVK
jgi:hypothetical protein